MDEHILAAAIGRDKAVALLGLEPFDGAFHGRRRAGRPMLGAGRDRRAAVDIEHIGDERSLGAGTDLAGDRGALRTSSKPARRRIAIGRNASCEPSAIVTKPKPLLALNHLTLASTWRPGGSSSRKKSGRRSNML